MNKFVLLLAFLISFFPVYSQDSSKTKVIVYNFYPKVELPLAAAGIVVNIFGIQYLKSKPGLTEAEVLKLSPTDVNKFDRSGAMQNPADSKPFRDASDWAMNVSYALPLLLLTDKNVRSDALKIGFLYLEAGAIMANAYAWGVGRINRLRPYVYNPDEPMGWRTRKGSFNSFYAGHPAAAAMCSFFMVKVYSDYHPDSRAMPWLYIAALAPPAIVGYMRYRAGMHFPSDVIAGTISGATIGYLVPFFHKKKDIKFSVIPVWMPDQKGLAFSYRP